MAIDTKEKRASIVAISFYPMGPSATPNVSQDQEWRQIAGYGYSGILAGTIVKSNPHRVGWGGGYSRQT